MFSIANTSFVALRDGGKSRLGVDVSGDLRNRAVMNSLCSSERETRARKHRSDKKIHQAWRVGVNLWPAREANEL